MPQRSAAAKPMRIAMWSGPRNISTALMRSWGSRPDCYVTDEPLYAHYLARTGLPHPGRAETLAAHPSRWVDVAAWLVGPVPEGKAVWYQKHMAHHLTPDVDRQWVYGLTNCFLIRDPRAMLASLIEFLPHPRLEDTGLPQQWELFSRLRARGGEPPPVLDGAQVLGNPRRALQGLCDRLGLVFDERMLRWEPGPRPTDGAWGPFWYDKVYATTGFAPPTREPARFPATLEPLYRQCREYYQRLMAYSHVAA